MLSRPPATRSSPLVAAQWLAHILGSRLFNVVPGLQWRFVAWDRTFRRCGGPTDSERLRCDHCYPNTVKGNQA